MSKEEIDDARMVFLWVLCFMSTVLIAFIIGNDNYIIIAPLPLYIIILSILVRWRRETWNILKHFMQLVIGNSMKHNRSESHNG